MGLREIEHHTEYDITCEVEGCDAWVGYYSTDKAAEEAARGADWLEVKPHPKSCVGDWYCPTCRQPIDQAAADAEAKRQAMLAVGHLPLPGQLDMFGEEGDRSWGA